MKGSVVNWAFPSLYEGSLEITLTVPLIGKNSIHRNIFYIIKLFAYIYIYVYLYICLYMLAIAGQTAGPNWLTMGVTQDKIPRAASGTLANDDIFLKIYFLKHEGELNYVLFSMLKIESFITKD